MFASETKPQCTEYALGKAVARVAPIVLTILGMVAKLVVCGA